MCAGAGNGPGMEVFMFLAHLRSDPTVTCAFNEITGELVRLRAGGTDDTVLIPPSPDCAPDACALLFDKRAVACAWAKMDAPEAFRRVMRHEHPEQPTADAGVGAFNPSSHPVFSFANHDK